MSHKLKYNKIDITYCRFYIGVDTLWMNCFDFTAFVSEIPSMTTK